MCQNIKRSRAAVSPEVINEYFDNLHVELQDVPAQNIVNYDETNLSDDPGRKKIIARRGYKYPERLMNSTKSSISVMFSNAGDGKILPPYVVYESLHLYQSWTEGGLKNARYNRTKSGWFDCFCFEDCLKTIAIPYLKKQTGKRILIGDNLASHLTVDVIKICRNNDIHLIFLPANSSHLTQPLDVAFFHPLKMAWRKILEDWMCGPGRNEASLPKDKFPELLKTLMDKVTDLGPNNVRSGLKKCGIVPLDRAPVLGRLPPLLETDEKQKENHLALDKSFVELLKTMRYGDNTNQPKRKKCLKIIVEPGKSVKNDSSPSSEGDIGLSDTDSSRGLESGVGDNNIECEDNTPPEEISPENCNGNSPGTSTTRMPVKYPFPVSVNDIKIGDWLLVNFSVVVNNPGTSTSGLKPLIGQVKSITKNGNFEGEFYRNRPSRNHQGFIYGLRNVPDMADFDFNQVMGRLNPPKEYQRGLKMFDITV